MDKERINPIVADRDDMIGRSTSDSVGDSSLAKSSTRATSQSMSGLWKLIVLISLLGLVVGGYLGWQQYQSFVLLQERFDRLNSRLNVTDESATQSDAAMQISISKQGDELKKHWSEIRKLWGVANDRNKGKIEKNSQDIKFLAGKRLELETASKNDRDKMQEMRENYFGLTADLESLNSASGEQKTALKKLQITLDQQQRQIQNLNEAITSIDGFRRQTNQKLLRLEQQLASKNNAEVVN
jgi:chromosome segregation ATPase